jgi:hypothetical protein
MTASSRVGSSHIERVSTGGGAARKGSLEKPPVPLPTQSGKRRKLTSSLNHADGSSGIASGSVGDRGIGGRKGGGLKRPKSLVVEDTPISKLKHSRLQYDLDD